MKKIKIYGEKNHNARTEIEKIPIDLQQPTSKATIVCFGPLSIHSKSFDFAPWYEVGIDSISSILQGQIERLLRGQDAVLAATTISTYCSISLKSFLQYLIILRQNSNKDLLPESINRDLMNGYISYLSQLEISQVTQKSKYSGIKRILEILIRRGLIPCESSDKTIFPRNPFPGVGHKSRGEDPLPLAQRNEFSLAVKKAVMPLFSDEQKTTSELLSYALLVIALHTGRNTQPLLEMNIDCLRSHPRDDLQFLVLYKRRANSMNKVAVKRQVEHDSDGEVTSTVRPTIARLINRVISTTAELRQYAPEHLRNRVWLYERKKSGRNGTAGEVTSLSTAVLQVWTRHLVERYKLSDTAGKPLRINVSRLRKTFINRVYEILDGDVPATAFAAGNTTAVTQSSYLRPGENAQRNWKFMGAALVQELLTGTIGATEVTPMGQCTSTTQGQYAPKQENKICMSFLNCVRCTNYVVTGDDLYRLFSFYWRVFEERSRMNPVQWKRQFSHIVRLIERDIVDNGISQGIFSVEHVAQERERAKLDIHPFWRSESILSDLSVGVS